MSDVEEIRARLQEAVDKSQEIRGMAMMCKQMSNELRALLVALWGSGIPPSVDFTDMVELASSAHEQSEGIETMMQAFVGKALDYSSRL
jgi:cell division GTPase FtsZ